jgi:nucleotide-binding universal stress UspA family protein
MSKHVIVGFDWSPEASEAVRWAADEASRRGWPLRLISCYHLAVAGDAVVGWTTAEVSASLLQAAEAGLAEQRQEVAERHPSLAVTTEAHTGPAAAGLLDHADAEDLLVLGASSHKGAAAFWLGSTPRHVIRRAPCPVVVVRGATSRGAADRVVDGIDGSPAADGALRWAAAEAELHGVPLLIVHGWEYPYVRSDASSMQARDLTEVDAATVLDRAVAEARELCSTGVDGRLVEAGSVSAVIGELRDGDLLVLGSRGRGMVKTGLFGSTVNGVLDRAAVPVVVVRDEELR